MLTSISRVQVLQLRLVRSESRLCVTTDLKHSFSPTNGCRLLRMKDTHISEFIAPMHASEMSLGIDPHRSSSVKGYADALAHPSSLQTPGSSSTHTQLLLVDQSEVPVLLVVGSLCFDSKESTLGGLITLRVNTFPQFRSLNFATLRSALSSSAVVMNSAVLLHRLDDEDLVGSLLTKSWLVHH